MALRTTVSAVIKILDPDGIEDMVGQIDDEELNIDYALEAANAQVTDLCTDSGYSDARLELIERWLAAHYASVSLPKTKQEAAKGLTETYEGQTKMGLDFTRYGQQAKGFDYKGNLAVLDVPGGKRQGKVYYVGGSPCTDDE